MAKYLIKLKPLSPYFFGSEETFGDRENKNYYAKSNAFPQQTTILGVLRKELLIQAGLFKEKGYSDSDRKRITALIGGQFNLGQDNDFGVVKKISPVFLTFKDKYYLVKAKDFNYSFEKKHGVSKIHTRQSFIPCLVESGKENEPYNSKKRLANGFMSKDGEELEFEKVFKEFVKVGINIDKKENDKGKFYKQKFYTMPNDYSFAVIAEIDYELESSILFLGADNSSFQMEVVKGENNFEELFYEQKPVESRIVLLSNTLVDKSCYDLCSFALTETVDFRFMNLCYGKFYKGKSKSSKYNMLKAGSVLYFSEYKRTEIEEKLNHKTLQQIGYNIYK